MINDLWVVYDKVDCVFVVCNSKIAWCKHGNALNAFKRNKDLKDSSRYAIVRMSSDLVHSNFLAF
jgi:hypothetical protein